MLLLLHVCYCRVLISTDVLAHETTLLLLAVTFGMIQVHLPSEQHEDVRFGPQQLPLSMASTFLLYGGTAIAVLVLLVRKPDTYLKHRFTICLAIRVTRLVVQLLTLTTPSAVVSFATVLAVRGQTAPTPQKATAILVLQPIPYYLQPAMLLLPWYHVVWIQLVSTGAMLHWVWFLPCFLHQPSTAPVWEPAAEVLCGRAQSYMALLRTAMGGSLSDLSEPVCEGLSGLQALQAFANLAGIFVLPVTATYLLERWVECRCHAQATGHSGATTTSSSSSGGGLGAGGRTHSASDAQPASWSQAGSSAGGSSSSSTSRSSLLAHRGGSSSSSSMLQRSGALFSASSLLLPAEPQGGSDRDVAVVESFSAHCGMVALVLVLVLPVLWLLAELLAELFVARRDCAAVLSAAGLA